MQMVVNVFSSFHCIYRFLVRFRNIENPIIAYKGGIFIFRGYFHLFFLFQCILHVRLGSSYIIASSVNLFNIENPIIALEGGILIFSWWFSLIFLYRWILHVCLGSKTTLLPLGYFFSFQFSISDFTCQDEKK